MLSADQRSWLGYSAPGLLSDLQLAVRVSPLLAAQLGMAGGIFFSSVVNGALLAPMLGGTLHWPLAGLPTYGALNVGLAITGELVRPFARAVLGVDWSVSSQLTLGPVLGLDWVTQRDGSVYSSDAIYGWVGISLGFRPVRFAPKLAQKAQPEPVEPEPVEPDPPPMAAAPIPQEPAHVHEPLPPSPELNALIDDAVQVSRTELLAPVLFQYDSVDLEPSSVAMLHEVARMLNQERKRIELVAVIAYADNQGSAEYNLALSGRRARHVRDWLVAHGVAAERLTTEARGASEPVEVGERADQQQNRRVTFRVLREETRP
jgi:outer membrane protein OmpA-like peptidoglycan-associated protein